MLCDASMRADGGQREASERKRKQEKSLPASHAYSSKVQRRMACGIALASGKGFSSAALYSRGELSLAKALRVLRAAETAVALSVRRRKLDALKATETHGPSGRKRQAVGVPGAWMALAPQHAAAGEKASSQRGTGYAQADIAGRQRAVAGVAAIERARPKVAPVSKNGKRASKRSLPCLTLLTLTLTLTLT